MKIKKIVNSILNISTKPHYESHTWGSHSSIISKVFYYLLFIIRYFSFLQIIKFIFRGFRKWRLKSSPEERLDPKSRLDFHAHYTELYLFSVFLVSIALYLYSNIYLMTYFHTTLTYISIILLIESVVWVFYYMLFRILMERKLTIYDEAEYLIVLPIVIFTQVFLVSFIFPLISPLEVLSLLFNLGNISGKSVPLNISLPLGVAGISYITVIIASLIKIVPSIPVWKRPNLTIIGSGDVVRERILPSVLKLYRSKQISVASDFIDDSFKKYLKAEKISYYSFHDTSKIGFYTHQEREEIKNNIIAYIKSRSSYAIIATPSDEHFPYIISLANEGIKFAVEKPICVATPHVITLKNADSTLMESGFLLSYYWLEKALPLNYFLTLNPSYRDLLNIRTFNETLDTPSAFSFEKRKLGKAVLFVMEFLEGNENENRFWTELQETGGMVTETLIHPISLIKNVLGCNLKLEIKKGVWIRNEERHRSVLQKHQKDIGPTYVDMVGNAGGCNLRIRVGKYTNYKRRILHIIYENGKITCDFDKQSCIVYKGNNISCIELQLKHKEKYDTQMLLFHEFMQKGWKGIRFDDFPSQLNSISECLDIFPDESSIKNIKREDLNNWLHANPLFNNGSMTINTSNVEDRFGP